LYRAGVVNPVRSAQRSETGGCDARGWLARLRGPLPPHRHTARTIAALTRNPGCHRRALLDSAGVDKQRLARQVGFPARVGQSPFAIARSAAFAAQVTADGGAELLRLARERLGLTISEARYVDLRRPDHPLAAAGVEAQAADRAAEAAPLEDAYAATRATISDAVRRGDAGVLLDHPTLRLEVAGQPAYLEPGPLALAAEGRHHVITIKSFAILDGQADPAKVSAAAIESAVYVLALRHLLADIGHDAELVSPEVLLVCPRDFSNQPTAAVLDVRKQLGVLRRQLARMARVEALLASLPPDLTFDLAVDAEGVPTRPPEELAAALRSVAARYTPECLAVCELAYFCRQEAAGTTAALGRSVQEQLGGVESVETVLGLASGRLTPQDEQAEVAALLRAAARLRAEALSAAAPRTEEQSEVRRP
jgi:hypothetical protein